LKSRAVVEAEALDAEGKLVRKTALVPEVDIDAGTGITNAR